MPDQSADEDPGAKQRRWPVRLILIGVVFALVLPGLVFCGILLGRIASGERARSVESAQLAARRTADTLDREIGYLEAALTALATSPALGSSDMATFAMQTHAVSEALGHEIVLSDPQGQQLANSRRPEPSPLPRMGTPATVQQAVETARPAVSGLFRSGSDGSASLAILVPVVQQGRVIYVLGTNLRPAAINGVLRDQKLPPGWTISVTDAMDKIFARSERGEEVIGTTASPSFRKYAVEDSSTWIGDSFEGVPILAATQRQKMADWRVSVGIPLSVVEAPLRSTILLLAVTGSITLVMACVLAWRLADSVAVPLGRLARAGKALAEGLPVYGVRSSIAEVDAVSRALVKATHDLRSRADALAAERAQLAAIIETVPVGLVIAEAPFGRIVAGNSQVERIFRHPIRLSRSTAEYSEWNVLDAEGQPVPVDALPLARALRGEPHAEMQCQCQCDDGTRLWLQLVAAPIRAPDGTLTGAIVAILDIDEAVRAREAKARFAETLEAQVAERTAALRDSNQRLHDEIEARSAAEDQLRQAQKMEAVGQLTGGIAHDFNNLLTIIVGSLDLLRRRVPEGAEGDRPRRLLDSALEGAGRAATLTARLLAFSRRQPLSPQPINANRLVTGMADLLHRTLGEAVHVRTVLAGGLWQTHADPNQLENALLNLAVNARDAMVRNAATPGTQHGTLTIATANKVLGQDDVERDPEVTAGDYVSLSVTDTGAGMDPEVASRVFEPFFTTKPPGQGTGLGLSQVHGFVKQSGGQVSIRSAPGEGTTVTIDLPRFTGAAETPAEIAPPAEETLPLDALTVLLVEDEPEVRRYSAEALRELGHTVLEASDPAMALRLLDAHPEVSLLFSDVILPQMNGPNLAEEVRRRRPHLPVLFTSGYTGEHSPGQTQNQMEPGILLLPKPFTLEALAMKLHEALREVAA